MLGSGFYSGAKSVNDALDIRVLYVVREHFILNVEVLRLVLLQLLCIVIIRLSLIHKSFD